MEGFRTVEAGATVQFVHKRGDKGLMAVEVLPLSTENGRPRCNACGQEVPVEAAPVTALSVSDPTAGQGGFTGNIDQLRQDIQKIPPGADRDASMAQLERQILSQT
mgnify:CR=1 FL=1